MRGVYSAYIGWFDGLPRNLRPLHPKVSSPKILKLAGKEAIVQHLLESIQAGQSCSNSACAHENLQWALELVDILLYSGSLVLVDFHKKIVKKSTRKNRSNQASIFIHENTQKKNFSNRKFSSFKASRKSSRIQQREIGILTKRIFLLLQKCQQSVQKRGESI